MGNVYGVIQIDDIFVPDKEKEATLVYQTDDGEHPGVRNLYNRGDVYVGGEIKLVKRIERPLFQAHYLDPVETRKAFAEKGWKTLSDFKRGTLFTVRMNTFKRQLWRLSMAYS